MGKLLENLTSRKRRRFSPKGALIVLIALCVLVAVLLLTHISAVGVFFETVVEYLCYGFIRRALIVGVLVSLCAALLGVTLVLKNYSMIGDGLSHVGFGAISIASAMGFVHADALPAFLPEGLRIAVQALCASVASEPMIFTLIVVVLLAVLILRVNEQSSIRGDAVIAMLSTGALAVGVLVTSTTSGMNADLMNYMFGSILAMSDSDVIISVILSAIVLLLFVLFYERIFAMTFDERFARATGTKVAPLNMMIAVLTAVTIVVGMRMMGTMLISSLIIFPALTSMRLFSSFRSVVISSAVVSVGCFVTGIFFSCVYSLPAGAGIVLVNIVCFLFFALLGDCREKGYILSGKRKSFCDNNTPLM